MISNYAELCDSIENELARSDLRPHIPEWVQTGQRFIERKIRVLDGEQLYEGNLVVDQEFIDLPDGFRRPIHIEIQSSTIRTLSIVTWDKRSNVLENDYGPLPRSVTFLGRRAYLAPVPQDTTAYKLFYYGQPALLSEENPTNDMLKLAPDALKYAALMYSATFLGDDERILIWKGIRDEAIDTLGKEYFDSKFYGAEARIRTDFAPGDQHT